MCAKEMTNIGRVAGWSEVRMKMTRTGYIAGMKATKFQNLIKENEKTSSMQTK